MPKPQIARKRASASLSPHRNKAGGGFGKNFYHFVIKTGVTIPCRVSGLSVLIEFLRIFQMKFACIEFVYSDGNRFATV